MILKYDVLISSSRKLREINRYASKFISQRYVSNGIQRWDKPLSTEIKFEIDNYWKDKIGACSGNRTNNVEDKVYVLSMFPYPSGSLHMGHVRVYALSDIMARYYRMNGKHVIHPIGWDAFGLPAENAANERNVNPAEWTRKNIEHMREQLKSLRCSFDWNREIATCDPEYYKWTQELFLKLYDSKLAYKKHAVVNWDPVDQTVLADEQVSQEGISWRSGAKVEQKLLNQWFIKTTSFAKSLLDGLEDPILKEWKDIIKIQRNWIGECDGANFDFNLASDNPAYPNTLSLWTDKPEFIAAVKFLAISRNGLLQDAIKIDASQETIKLPDVRAVNPITNDKIPVFVTDELEFPQGRDDYLGIPCASEKDAEFCTKMGIEFEAVQEFSEEMREQKKQEILQLAKEKNIGGFLVSSHLKDWLISRQRYWGTPIPIINCKKCGDRPVPRDQLPVTLPVLNEVSKGKNLSNAHDWLNVKCPDCGGPAKREADTMDTFVDSTWYFMRYLDPKNHKEMFNKEKVEKCLPVDLYIGGKEHACLHLYFSRFVNHFLYTLGLVPTQEPFKQLVDLGMVMGTAYKVKSTGKYLKESEVEKKDDKYYEKSTGSLVVAYWDKMSKSKYNGVDPIEMFSEHTVDTIRLVIMSDVSPTTQRNWSKEAFETALSWENKLWLLMRKFWQVRHALKEGTLDVDESKIATEDAELFQQKNYHLKYICSYISGTQSMGIAIAKMMSFTKRLRKTSESGMAKSHEFERALATQIIMLAPIAPHFASELWAGFCSMPGRLINDGSIKWDKEVLEQDWPQVDMNYELDVRVHINLRTDLMTVKVPRRILANATVEEITQLVLEQKKVQNFIKGWEIVDVNYHSLVGLDADIRFKTKRIEEKISQETTG